jgi:hypothetical protein
MTRATYQLTVRTNYTDGESGEYCGEGGWWRNLKKEENFKGLCTEGGIILK